MSAPGPGRHLKSGEPVESEIHYARGAAELIAANAFEKVAGQFAGLQEFLEGKMRINARTETTLAEISSPLCRAMPQARAIFNKNFSRRLLFGANLHASFARGISNRVGNGVPGAAPG